MPKKDKNHRFYIFSILLMIQLAFLYYIKYQNQELSLNNFTILKTGNLLNLLIYVGIILVIYFNLRNNKVAENKKSVAMFIILSWLFLIFSFISTRIRIISASYYIFNQPADKVLTGLLFLIYLTTLLFYLIYYFSSFMRKQKPKILKTTLFTILILFAFFILSMIYIDNIGYTSGRWAIKKDKDNIGVVLGAAVWSGNIPSPTLSARVDKALELYNQGFIGKIVLTGGKAPGELPESEVAYEYAKTKGADTLMIRIESSTSSTTDQIKWIKNNLSIDNSSAEIILISDAYHLPRAIEISKFFNLDVKVAESIHKMNFEDKFYNKIRETVALFNFWNFGL